MAPPAKLQALLACVLLTVTHSLHSIAPQELGRPPKTQEESTHLVVDALSAVRDSLPQSAQQHVLEALDVIPVPDHKPLHRGSHEELQFNGQRMEHLPMGSGKPFAFVAEWGDRDQLFGTYLVSWYQSQAKVNRPAGEKTLAQDAPMTRAEWQEVRAMFAEFFKAAADIRGRPDRLRTYVSEGFARFIADSLPQDMNGGRRFTSSEAKAFFSEVLDLGATDVWLLFEDLGHLDPGTVPQRLTTDQTMEYHRERIRKAKTLLSRLGAYEQAHYDVCEKYLRFALGEGPIAKRILQEPANNGALAVPAGTVFYVVRYGGFPEMALWFRLEAGKLQLVNLEITSD